MQDAFDADPAFKDAMDALTPGRQREYNEHIASAKREATQHARLVKILLMVLDGKGPTTGTDDSRGTSAGWCLACSAPCGWPGASPRSHDPPRWVEPGYGTFLLLGTLLVWAFLWRERQLHSHSLPPLRLAQAIGAGFLAGLVSGPIHVASFWIYTELLNPNFLNAFVAWNAENSSNSFDVANREFRLPGFLDILLVHPVIFNPIAAALVTFVLTKSCQGTA